MGGNWPRKRNSIDDRPSRSTIMWRRYRRFLWGLPPVVFAITILLYINVVSWRLSTDAQSSTIRDAFHQVLVRSGFQVDQVLTEGRSRTSLTELQDALGNLNGASIFSVNLDAIRHRLEQISTVATAAVSRQLPDKVLVFLTERVPYAVWQNEKKFFFVDRHGAILGSEIKDSQEVLASIGLPFILGPSAPARFSGLFELIKGRPELIKSIELVELVGNRRWDLWLRSGAKVLLPEGHEAAALRRLAELHQQTALLERPVKTIDMRLGDRLVINPGQPAKPMPPGRL